MEATTTPDPLCVTVIMLKGQIKHLQDRDEPMLQYVIERLERILESVEAVEDGLKQAYIHAPSAAEAQRIKAILHP